MLQSWIDAFDPAQGMPPTMSLGGPEDVLIEARTPAAWRAAKDEIFAGMDAYAVKALGLALMGDRDADASSLRAGLPAVRCLTTVIAGEHDHPMVDQAPALATEVANGRLQVIEGAYHSPQLTHAEQWRAAVRAHLAWADAERAGP